ncbi:chromosome partitioning protein ParA [Xylophilus sp. Kf1]|nr:chromosome partitioning protein ParA [Xylophilus sp. Kf1]
MTTKLFSLRAGLAATALLLAASLAGAQSADPPARVARFEAFEGGVQFQSASTQQTLPADPLWPLTRGDRVWAAAGGRAELHAGDASIRLGDGGDMSFTTLDDRTAQVRLTSGTLGVVVRDLQAGDRVEIDTPNLALVLDRPGRWRLDVDPGRNTTRVTAEHGSGTLYGANGQPLAFAAPLSREFAFQSLAGSAPLANRIDDAFDRWSDNRDRLAAQSPSLRYASADIPGVAQLDAYGDWGNDARYGAIWYPRSVAADWAPYRHGRWEWIEPWGWNWIDDAPWGFAPFHYGRWTQAGDRWGWVPGPQRGRPAYAPAVVGFVGGQQPGRGAPPGTGWFPLAPGERWKPPFPASPGYIARLNRAGFTQDNTNGYYYQTRPGAVTLVPGGDIQRPGFGGGGQGAYGRQPYGFDGNAGQGRPMMQPLPPNAPLSDRVRQDQWERNQRTRQDQHQADMLRQQQTREAQQRFQPSYGQRELQAQQEQVQRQQQDLMRQQQRQQQDQMFQQQRQQQQAQQQQERGRQQQIEQQQRQFQGEQQRQQQMQQLQRQQQQQMQVQQQMRQGQFQGQPQAPMQRPGGQQRPGEFHQQQPGR